jgi:hypothetical protein
MVPRADFLFAPRHFEFLGSNQTIKSAADRAQVHADGARPLSRNIAKSRPGA